MTFRKLCLIALMYAGSFVPAALAQEAPAADTRSTSEIVADYTIKDWLRDGGSIGYVIVGVSVIALAMVIESAVTIRTEKLCPADLLNEIEALLEAGDYQEAMELCEAQQNFLTNVVAAGLPKISIGFGAIEKSLEEMVEEEALKLHSKIGWMSFIASVATLLGLLGTISGMILAFRTIAATKGQADPSQLSTGISAALITTEQGLMVAIPASFAFTFFRNKVVKHTLEIAAVVEDLFERFRSGTQPAKA